VLQKLLDLGETAVKHAEKKGAQQAEAFLTSDNIIRIWVEKGAIKSVEEKHDAGCGIRTIDRKRIGFSFVTTHEPKDIYQVTEKAVQLSKSAIPNPDFKSLPSYDKSYPNVKGIFDSHLDELDADNCITLLLRAVEANKNELKKTQGVTEAVLIVSTAYTAIVNSLGVNGSYKETSIALEVSSTVKHGGHQASSFEEQFSRDLKHINPEWVGREAARVTLSLLAAKTSEKGEMPVILAPFAINTIFGAGLVQAINAEEVQLGRSFLAEKVGQPIASETLEIVDDGFLTGGVKTRPFDAEGFPSQHTRVFQNGILHSLLYDSYTSQKADIANTGNAARNSYADIPRISSTNFIIQPGKGSFDELVGEIDKGIICRETGDKPNIATGDLSAMVMEGYFIKNNEIQYPIKNTLIGINMQDLLQRIQQIGADTRTCSRVVSPSIVISSAKITSG
jgi:PmbA protein